MSLPIIHTQDYGKPICGLPLRSLTCDHTRLWGTVAMSHNSLSHLVFQGTTVREKHRPEWHHPVSKETVSFGCCLPSGGASVLVSILVIVSWLPVTDPSAFQHRCSPCWHRPSSFHPWLKGLPGAAPRSGLQALDWILPVSSVKTDICTLFHLTLVSIN